MFSKIAEIRPPEIPPIYTATSIFMPREELMLKVSGSIRATAMEAERPGMEPKMIPITTPAIIRRKDRGWQTESMAEPSCERAFMRHLLQFDDSRRQDDLEAVPEQDIYNDGKNKADYDKLDNVFFRTLVVRREDIDLQAEIDERRDQEAHRLKYINVNGGKHKTFQHAPIVAVILFLFLRQHTALTELPDGLNQQDRCQHQDEDTNDNRHEVRADLHDLGLRKCPGQHDHHDAQDQVKYADDQIAKLFDEHAIPFFLIQFHR